MPTTPIYGLPWPNLTDTPDVPRDMQALAVATEAALAAPAASLPASPVDGQVARYLVSANGPVWTFVYLAGSAAPYRWHAIGSPVPLRGFVPDAASRSGPFGYADPSTGPPGPFFNLPLAGDYLFNVAFRAYQPGGVSSNALPHIAGIAAVAAYSVTQNTSPGVAAELTQSRTDIPHTATAAGAEARLLYAAGSGTVTWYDRAMSARPVRVA